MKDWEKITLIGLIVGIIYFIWQSNLLPWNGVKDGPNVGGDAPWWYASSSNGTGAASNMPNLSAGQIGNNNNDGLIDPVHEVVQF